MFLAEPPRSQGDLNFSVFGIPVRVHPFFWLVGLLLGIGGTEGDPKLMIVWLLAVFFSILIHELGHALVARAYGYRPWITLHGMGGLASFDPQNLTPKQSILISLAGPGAGFGLAAVIVAGIAASGHLIDMTVGLNPVIFYPYLTQPGGPIAPLDVLLVDLLFVNIFWGLINLFPVYPLDGGQISKEIFIELDPRGGVRRSLTLSIGSAAFLAVFALLNGSFYMAFLFGYLAYSSYTTLQSYSGQSGMW